MVPIASPRSLQLPDGDDSAALLPAQVVDESASAMPTADAVDASATCELERGEHRIRVRGLSMSKHGISTVVYERSRTD